MTLPATNGNNVTTPDVAANSITGDIDIRMKIALADWTPAATQGLAEKGITTNNGWDFFVRTDGTLRLRVGTAGGIVTNTSTVATGVTDGAKTWLRVTRASGSGSVNFYLSSDGSAWNQLGTTVAGTAGAIGDNATALAIASNQTGSFNPNGTLYYFDIRSAIGGAVAQVFDPSAVTILGTRSPSSVVASTGETWTINGSAWNWATVAP